MNNNENVVHENAFAMCYAYSSEVEAGAASVAMRDLILMDNVCSGLALTSSKLMKYGLHLYSAFSTLH